MFRRKKGSLKGYLAINILDVIVGAGMFDFYVMHESLKISFYNI